MDDLKDIPDIPALERQSSDEIVKTWVELYKNINNVLPEYRKAAEMVCVNTTHVSFFRTVSVGLFGYCN